FKNKKTVSNRFLPTTKAEMLSCGFKQADVILVTGDAYVDHPSFGVALIGRWLESLGYKVAILAQPGWKSVDDFRSLGRPRLFWAITSGAVDSRLNDYASMGHRRKEDVYSPNGKTGLRPNRPLLVYSARAREAYKDVPIVLGGLEASLRRLAHYDYIEDKLKRSVLIDAKADLLVHGMAETAIAEIADRLNKGQTIDQLIDIPGTCYRLKRDMTIPDNAIELPSLSQQQQDKKFVMEAQNLYQPQAMVGGLPVVQDQAPGKIVVLPPAEPLNTAEMDKLYSLHFERKWHPKYDKTGGVPALKPIQFSITSHRGCFGGCNFCAIYFHQGKVISSRSVDSILKEAESFKDHPDFKGTISDIGGPTANMYGMRCTRRHICKRPSCLFPSPCRHLKKDHAEVTAMMQAVRKWQKSSKKKINVFIASGVRHDLALESKQYMELLFSHFVSGQLKIAPEHFDSTVLSLMGKLDFTKFEKFEKYFDKISKKIGKKQYLIPYFISSHPGCSSDDALKLTEYLVSRNWRPRQVQDFTPVALAASTAMYVSGLSPTGKKIHVPRGHSEKTLQLAMMQYYLPENYKRVADWLGRRRPALLSKMKRLQIERDVQFKQKKRRRR
ncbi:MAG: YgiQ family radical SAM protein, partial [Planctomycetes bacterium]|nr:YgiQ family radical SAM protein [Planctomycetota bacterium]